MAENSKIQWTHHTFNPWRGCTKVSPGCKNCYAETLSARNPKTLGVWGPNGTRVVAAESTWREPLKWNKWAAEGICWHCGGRSMRDTPGKCEVCNGKGKIGPYRARVFCASLADVFEDWNGEMRDSGNNVLFHCPRCDSACWSRDALHCDGCLAEGRLLTMDDVRERLFSVIDETPNLDWLMLTKRPSNIARLMPPFTSVIKYRAKRRYPGSDHSHPNPFPHKTKVIEYDRVRHNVWLGTSVENQDAADDRIPHLLRAPAAIRFLSCEPLLGSVVLAEHALHGGPASVDWVIVGGESGSNSRPFAIEWARTIRDHCRLAGTAFFMKQLGSVVQATGVIDPLDQFPSFAGSFTQGPNDDTIQLQLKDAKGGNPDEWPEDLRVREFPRANR